MEREEKKKRKILSSIVKTTLAITGLGAVAYTAYALKVISDLSHDLEETDK